LILVDTSVWVDHLRLGSMALAGLLDRGMVSIHPFVIGELSLGNLRDRGLILGLLSDLPAVAVASDSEVLHFIDRNGLAGRGIGLVDAHLLASTRLSAGTTFWTKDKRLHAVSAALGLAAAVPKH
jgi:predicted nucleic acid-binding protein